MSQTRAAMTEQQLEEIAKGERCYGCGGRFEVSLEEAERTEQWDANPEHAACFE